MPYLIDLSIIRSPRLVLIIKDQYIGMENGRNQSIEHFSYIEFHHNIDKNFSRFWHLYYF